MTAEERQAARAEYDARMHEAAVAIAAAAPPLTDAQKALIRGIFQDARAERSARARPSRRAA